MQNSLVALGIRPANVTGQFNAGQQAQRQEQTFQTQQSQQALKQLDEGVRGADTPEKWAQLVEQSASIYGPDVVAPFADFATRGGLLAKLENSLPERQFNALQTQRANSNRNTLASLNKRQSNADRAFDLNKTNADRNFDLNSRRQDFAENKPAKPITNVGRINRAVSTGEITAQEGDALRSNATAPKKGITVSPDGTVTIGGSGKFGKIPTGMVLKQGENGAFFEAVPGGPVDKKNRQAIKSENAKKVNDTITSNIVTQDIDRAIDIIDNGGVLNGTGITGLFLSGLPGTDAFALSKFIDTVKANAGFDKLQRMRDASPTGGALGQVSERELVFLQAAIGNLEQAQKEDILKFNLERVRKIYSDIINGPTAQVSVSAVTVPETATNPQTGEKLEFRDGQWVPAQ